MPTMVVAVDTNNKCIFWNKGCEQVSGYAADEIINNPNSWHLLFPDEKYRSRVIEQWELRKKSFESWKTTIATCSGKKKTICWSNIRNTIDLPITSFWTVGVDITQNKIAEQKLRSRSRSVEYLAEKRNLELQQTNLLLTREIETRKETEKKLRKHQRQLSALSSELLLTEERERRQIARDLHDRISQYLTISCNKLENLKRIAPKGKIANTAHEIENLIRQTIKDTRTLIFEISPPILYEMGLEPALEWFAEQIEAQYDIEVSFHANGDVSPLDRRDRVLVFRATRELMLNVARHSGAKHAVISVHRGENTLFVEVKDDGCGFSFSDATLNNHKSGCFGLFSIQERLKYLGGQFVLESEPGKGTCAKIIVPLKTDYHHGGE